MEVKGKVVIITGAGRGIGEAIATLFAEKKAKVVLAARTTSEIERVRERIQTDGGVAIAIPTDVRDRVSVRNLVNRTLSEFGQVDILVNNAGIAVRKTLLETDEKEFDNVMSTNVKGVFLCCKEVLSHMISNNSGIIVNISSGAGKSGIPELSVYCASKFAVIGLTESMAIETVSHGVKVYCVCPGSTDTQMFRSLYPERAHGLLKPKDVARVVLRVCEEDIPSGRCLDVY